jgi:adenosylcobinamide-phosphate synthase
MIDAGLTAPLWLTIPSALALDLILGDPQGWPHPVRWMGRAIEWFEPVCRRLWKSERWAGAVFAVTLIAASWAIAFGVVKSIYGLHLVIGFMVETVLIYYCLSVRALLYAATEIHALLVRREIDSARHKLSWIVSRDVERYQGEDIARATVETVAENFVDGVLSPLFFAAMGGAPLAVAYKMINTLDSMVGYKNERYIRFGTVAARIDDAANYLPARLSVAVIALAARLFPGRHGRRAFQTALEEGGHHTSPNAGYPEASFAGALAVRLNGPNYYHGRLACKPYIGVAFGPVTIGHIPQACQLMLVASLLGGLLFSVLACMVYG